jgi:hypothetical protein
MDAAEALALLMSPPGRIDPYPTYERLRAHGPVVRAGPVTIDTQARPPQGGAPAGTAAGTP